jgi:hypothetical protein
MSGRAIPMLAVLIATAAAAAGLAHWLRGDRYRVHVNAEAAHCWAAVKHLAPPSASLRLVRVEVIGDAPRQVVIVYQMDRVLAGLELEAHCTYGADRDRASMIAINGETIDAESLEDLNRRLR